METKLRLQIAPIQVPNFVTVVNEKGATEAPAGLTSIAVSHIEPETLSDLCDEFRRNLFARAGKKDPREPLR